MNPPTKQRGYTVNNLIKASGLLADVRLLFAAWDEGLSVEENLDAVVRKNLFGKSSRRRVMDVLNVFKQRYLLQNGSSRACRMFVNSALPTYVTDQVLYYYAALAEPVLYDFVCDVLFDRYYRGAYRVNIHTALDFISEAIREKKTQGVWESANTRERVAQGIIGSLRDFGMLEGVSGSPEKQISPPHLDLRAFCYISFHLKQGEPSGERLVNHPHWRLFLLGPQQVERLFAEADAEGLLTFQAAGSIIRVGFPSADFEEYVHALIQRAL